MPEETEIDTDSLREKIDEQREKRGGSVGLGAVAAVLLVIPILRG